MSNLFNWTYECHICAQINTFQHSGPRKEGLTCLTLQQCSACGEWALRNLLGGGPKPRQMQKKSRELQYFILKTFLQEEPPLTIRHVFYVCSNHRLVPKDVSGYRAVAYQIGLMRKAGSLPYSWVADNSRTIYKPKMYSSASQALKEMQTFYRRDLWAGQNQYVEIWVEKDAMAGVLAQVTDEYGVPLYVARGYSSDSFIWKSAEEIREIGKPTTIYQFGDFDYDGIAAAESIPNKLWKEHGIRVNFERVAVTDEQIREHGLPTRPPKLPGDNAPKKRREWAYDYCVDLDAMPAPVVRQLVADCITRHLDEQVWVATMAIEQQERNTLAQFAKNFSASTKLLD